MSIDVVTAPVRYRRLPMLLLVLIAVGPTIGLIIGYRWLADEADRYEAARTADEVITTFEPEAGLDRTNVVALRTPMLQYRRVAQPVADIANANRLRDEIEPGYLFLDQNSCFAVSVDGLAVTAHNPTGSVIPASTQKLVVAAVALHLLGDDFTFETQVLAPFVVDGVVEGDVFLVGGGDPMLVSSDVPHDDDGFARTSLDLLADAFVASGIERVNGGVVGDGDRYDDEFVVDSWGDGVAGVEAGPYDALLVNDGFVLDRSSRQSDPNAAAARELRRLLDARGVRVGNNSSSGSVEGDVRVIGSVRSAPLSDIVGHMLTTSDNDTAELLLKEIGYVDSGEGSRLAGIAAVERTLREWGVPLDDVELVDGSGLSPDNSVTCAMMLSILQRRRTSPMSAGLAVAARSGTLLDEFVGSPLAGRLSAKTGTLGNPPFDEPPLASKALAGYVAAENGDTIEFVLIINAPELTTDSYRRLWALFGDRLATYPAGPSAIALQP